MDTIDAFTVPFYKFKAPDGLNEVILKDLQSRDWGVADRPEYGQKIPKYYREDLFDFFNKSINEFKDVYFEKNLTLPIVDCWANKYTKMNKLQKHMHSNSVICGLYYVTTHDNADTIWEMENPWTKNLCEGTPLWITKKNVSHALKANIPSQEGTLVLFPSQLYHYMNVYRDYRTPRYTIAFNCHVSGEICNLHTGRLFLDSK